MDRFDECLAVVAPLEGGFVDHPRDNGGRTKYGVTQRTLDKWRRSRGEILMDVADVTKAEVRQIFFEWFWLPVRGDRLPRGLDLFMFDYSINSGPGQAVRDLQRAVGAGVDGVFGPETLAGVRTADPLVTLTRLRDLRETLFREHEDFDVFGRGWLNRLRAIYDRATGDAVGDKVLQRAHVPRAPVPQARPGKRSKKADLAVAIRDPKTWAAAAGPLGMLAGALAKIPEPVLYGLGGGLFVGALAAAFVFVREREAKT
jgi:lysozyme family protein